MKTIAALLLLFVADANAKCKCGHGTGNTWQTNRACAGTLPYDGATNCEVQPGDEANRCPENAPIDEDNGYVWCDCLNEQGNPRKSATEAECLRTEGLSDEQSIAFQAMGVNVVDFDCDCCSCQSTLAGVPRVGEPGKQCNNGDLDPDENTCGDEYFIILPALIVLVIVIFACAKQKEKMEAEASGNSGKGAKSRAAVDSLTRSLSEDTNFRQNPMESGKMKKKNVKG